MIHGSNTPRSRISVKVFYAFIGNALRKSILLNRTDMVPLNYFCKMLRSRKCILIRIYSTLWPDMLGVIKLLVRLHLAFDRHVVTRLRFCISFSIDTLPKQNTRPRYLANIKCYSRYSVIWQTLSVQHTSSAHTSGCSTFFRENHDNVIKWKHFPRYWPFVRGIHR